MTTEPQPDFRRAPMIPMTWGVRCPVCGEITEFDAVDVVDDCDRIEPDGHHGAQFVECSCGQLLEAIGVTITTSGPQPQP